MTDKEKTPGQIAFEAYRLCMNQTAYDGTYIPERENVRDAVKKGWEAAAEAVIRKQQGE